MREARSRAGKRSEYHVFLQQRTARAGDGREMDDPSIAGLRLYRQMTFRSSDDGPPTPAKAIEPVPAPPSHTPTTAHPCAYHMFSNPYVYNRPERSNAAR